MRRSPLLHAYRTPHSCCIVHGLLCRGLLASVMRAGLFSDHSASSRTHCCGHRRCPWQHPQRIVPLRRGSNVLAERGGTAACDHASAKVIGVGLVGSTVPAVNCTEPLYCSLCRSGHRLSYPQTTCGPELPFATVSPVLSLFDRRRTLMTAAGAERRELRTRLEVGARGVEAAAVLRRSGTLEVRIDGGAGAAAVDARADATRSREQLSHALARLASVQALARRYALELAALRRELPGDAPAARRGGSPDPAHPSERQSAEVACCAAGQVHGLDGGAPAPAASGNGSASGGVPDGGATETVPATLAETRFAGVERRGFPVGRSLVAVDASLEACVVTDEEGCTIAQQVQVLAAC